MGSEVAAEIVEDCSGILQLYSDGSIHRLPMTHMHRIIASITSLHHDHRHDAHDDDDDDDDVEWRDCMYDEHHKLTMRVYRTKKMTKKKKKKMEVVYYFHGGGFCVGSYTWPHFHLSCLRLCSSLDALVLAPDYRLAPEHRLPAAIEDGMKAVKWLQLQAQRDPPCEWLDPEIIDFERVFVMGDSSGATIAHHLAVRLGPSSHELRPVWVRGYILFAPFFGGTVRTKSEFEGPPEQLLNLDILDRFWRLSLPIGETRDHPLANPFGPGSPNLEKVSVDPMLVIVGGSEIMKDRVEEYAKRLKEQGKEITYVEFEGMQHGFFTYNPYSHVAHQVLQLIQKFILDNSI